jgi:hypothetical protein
VNMMKCTLSPTRKPEWWCPRGDVGVENASVKVELMEDVSEDELEEDNSLVELVKEDSGVELAKDV